MNDTTLFLAQIFGPVLGFIGIGILFNRNFYMKAFKDFSKASFSYFVTVMAMIAIGVVLVTKHFLWGTLPEALISFIGLAFLIKGILLTIMPKAFDKLVAAIISKGLLTFAGILWLIAGLYFSYIGFFANFSI